MVSLGKFLDLSESAPVSRFGIFFWVQRWYYKLGDFMKKVKKKDVSVLNQPPIDTTPKKPKTPKKWLDWIEWVLALAVTVFLLFCLYRLSMFELQIVLSIAGVLLAFVLILLILLIKRKSGGWKATLYRIVLLLYIAGAGFGAYTLNNTYVTLNDITSARQSVIQIDLLTKADSSLDSVEDFAKKKIGYSNHADSFASSAAMADINTQTATVEYVDMNDYQQLYEKLQAGEIDGLLIPHNRISLLREEYKSIEKDTKTIETFKAEREITPVTSNIDISKEPFVVYVAGIDEGDDPSIDARSDVNILVMVDPQNNQMTTVSIPRDSYVPNPALENGSDKLTHLGNDGALNSMEGIEEAFGIDIDYYAKVNFQSLIHIVDALGGVDVDVKIDFNEQDENRSFKKSDKIYLKKGMQTLNGKEALAYARHRKTEGYGTTGRENAQQQIIQAIMKKLTTAEGISHINDLMNVASKYVATNMPLSAIQSFVSKQLRDVKPWSVDSITLKGGTDATLTTVSMPSLPLSCYLLSPGDIVKVYNAYQRMYDSSPMKNFAFNLSTNPQCTIKYPKDQSVSEFMITSAAADRLNPYSVYYGIDRVDSSNAGASEQRAQTNNIEIVVPQAPVYDYYVPSQPDYVPDTGGENTGSSEPVTPPATDPGTGDGDGTTTTPPSTDPGTGDGGGTTTPPSTDPGTGDNGGSTTPSEPVTPPADTGTAE